MIDVPQLIRDDLIADTAILALTDVRIWAERTTPEVGYKPTDGESIAFAVRGGTVDSVGINLTTSLQVKCYADTRIKAQQLYRAVHDRLHMTNSTEARPPILFSMSESQGQTLEEPDTEWPFVLAFFSITIRNS